MSEAKQQKEKKQDEKRSPEAPRPRPKFPKIRTRVKAGGPWRRY